MPGRPIDFDVARRRLVSERLQARKILEFRQLQYPRKMLWRACTTMGVSTRDPEWFRIRESLDDHTSPSHNKPPAH